MSEIISFNEHDYQEILLRSVALLPWSQNLLILSKDLNDDDTLFYANESRLKGRRE